MISYLLLEMISVALKASELQGGQKVIGHILTAHIIKTPRLITVIFSKLKVNK